MMSFNPHSFKKIGQNDTVLTLFFLLAAFSGIFEPDTMPKSWPSLNRTMEK